MPRPCKQRRVCCRHHEQVYKPVSRPLAELELVELRLDELEALRLCDHERMHHHESAELMGVSRATLGRIIASARGKLARLVLDDVALSTGGGNVASDPEHYRRGQAQCRRHSHHGRNAAYQIDHKEK